MQISRYSAASGGGGRLCIRTSFVDFKKLYSSARKAVSIHPSIYIINLSNLSNSTGCLPTFVSERARHISRGSSRRERDERYAKEEIRNVLNIFIGISEGKRPLGKRRLKWKDNVKINRKFVAR